MDSYLSRELAIETFSFKLNYYTVNRILIIGDRATGKTQLANYLKQEFQKRGLTAHIVEEEVLFYRSQIDPDVFLEKFGLDPVIVVCQARDTHQLYRLPSSVDLIVNAGVVDFDRSVAFYGPDSPECNS